MTVVPALAEATVEAMGGEAINISTTMVARVWPAEGCTKTKADGNPDGVVLHPEAQ